MDAADIDQNIEQVARMRDLYPKHIDRIKEDQGKQKRKISGDRKNA